MNQDFSTPADVRARNLSLTVNIIRESGSLTRASLIETTHLSATTISSLVNVLIASDFVHEAGTGLSSGGRRPVVLEFNYDARAILGVDMGATHITAVLINLSGMIRARLTRSVDVVSNPQEALTVLRSMIFQIMSQARPYRRPIGCRLHHPGAIDQPGNRGISDLLHARLERRSTGGRDRKR